MTAKFDPNAAASADSGIFGLPVDESGARLVFVPVPWEVTTSYGGGTSQGPAAILEASRQVDLFDLDVEKPYEAGFHMREARPEITQMNAEGRELASQIIELGGDLSGAPELKPSLARVNELGARLNDLVYSECRELIRAGKIVGLVGGDHSTPFGSIRAHAEEFKDLGILHFDAHSDTRMAYEGFTDSHASIMYNVLERLPQVSKLVQVGIRDVCEQEIEYCSRQGRRVRVFFDRDVATARLRGESFSGLASQIVEELPKNVYVSFDIDGLDPRFCPHTGTPVAGGLDFNEAVFILRTIVESGRRIVGFDLNEVAPGPEGSDLAEWDANCGARLLYKLSGFTLASQGLAELRLL
jgi:agmatinase